MMAFATKHLRILCKIHSGSRIATFSTLRQPVKKIALVQTAQKYCYTTETNRPKIADSLTNIQSTTIPSQQQNTSEEEEKDQEDEDSKKTDEQEEKNKWKNSFIALAGVSMGVSSSYIMYKIASPSYDIEGNIIEDEFTHLPYFEQMFKRLRREFKYFEKLIQEPSRDKLLPDPLPYPYIQPPYTLVLELMDVLVHPDWTYQTGWRFKKRPGVDQFFEAVAPPQFEIVVFCAESGTTVFPILDALDSKGYIMYRLIKDATRFVDGHHVKDLSVLNRDLSKVIVVDWNGENVKFHPENLLKLPQWSGNDDDTTLFDLAAFLKTIQVANVDDVRDVLTYYRQFENPLEAFKENQRKLLVQLEEEEGKVQKEGSSNLASKWRPSFLRNH